MSLKYRNINSSYVNDNKMMKIRKIKYATSKFCHSIALRVVDNKILTRMNSFIRQSHSSRIKQLLWTRLLDDDKDKMNMKWKNLFLLLHHYSKEHFFWNQNMRI